MGPVCASRPAAGQAREPYVLPPEREAGPDADLFLLSRGWVFIEENVLRRACRIVRLCGHDVLLHHSSYPTVALGMAAPCLETLASGYRAGRSLPPNTMARDYGHLKRRLDPEASPHDSFQSGGVNMTGVIHSASLFDEPIDRGTVPSLKVRSAAKSDGPALFSGGVADMDFRAAPPILAAMRKRLAHGVFGYESVQDGLFPSLIAWLAERHCWHVGADDIVRSPNVLDALAIAASLFVAEDEGVIVQPPVFFDFFDILRENHRRLIPNPLALRNGRYEIDFADLEEKARDPRARMIYLCNPHNPVGRVWSGGELRQVGDICSRHGVLVAADEMHGDITYSEHRYTPFASLGEAYAANCITFVSPAKSFNIASCCSSFTLISDKKRRAAFDTENSRLTVNKNNAFANVAMEAAYRNGASWLDALLTYLEGNLALVRERLKTIPAVRLIEPEGTFLLWLDFRELGLDPQALRHFLRSHVRWDVINGSAFGHEGAGFSRLNIACPRKALDVALDQLEGATR
jgi:cysteine-S-conjugate beta-lyase